MIIYVYNFPSPLALAHRRSMFDHFSPNQLQDSSTHPCSTVQKKSKRTFKHFTKARGWIIAADSLRASVQYFVCSMVEVHCRYQHWQILQQKYNISNEKSPLMSWMLLWCFHLDCVCMSRNWDHSVIAALLRSQHFQELTGIYWLHCPRMIRMRLDGFKCFKAVSIMLMFFLWILWKNGWHLLTIRSPYSISHKADWSASSGSLDRSDSGEVSSDFVHAASY